MKMRVTLILSGALLLCACSNRPDAADTTLASAATPAPPAGATATSIAPGEVQQSTSLIDPNGAAEAQLVAGGLSADAAKAVIAARPHADMLAVDKILAAQSLTPEQRKAIYAKVWKPIDLNTASKAEILLIPGVGNRMLHEFEEYRPYKSMEQFRREIGKYVDKTELERLAMYVSVK
jgi:DNA uptake protein ComE-like DNA-binding protein